MGSGSVVRVGGWGQGWAKVRVSVGVGVRVGVRGRGRGLGSVARAECDRVEPQPRRWGVLAHFEYGGTSVEEVGAAWLEGHHLA